MNGRNFGLILLALMAAAAAAWMAKVWLQAHSVKNNPAIVACAVAAVNIGYAEKIQAAQVSSARCLPESLPRGAFRDAADAVGKFALQPLAAGDILSAERLADKLADNVFSSRIKPGMRALTVRVDDVAGIAAFVSPGNSVDLLATGREGSARTLLEKLTVLAVDQKSSAEKDKPSAARALTLEVTPEQAEMIVKAGRAGPLHFTLRRPDDDSALPTREAREAAEEEALATAKNQRPSTAVTVFHWGAEGGRIERCGDDGGAKKVCGNVVELK